MDTGGICSAVTLSRGSILVFFRVAPVSLATQPGRSLIVLLFTCA